MNLTPSPRSPAPILAALAFALCATSALAQASPVRHAEILPGWVEANGQRMAALRLELAPGWHTYFRIPGDSGLAPVFDWSESQNLGSLRAIWPAPQIFEQNGYVSFGYEDELILPLEITPVTPGRPVALMGRLEIGVCRETCVPAEVSVAGALRGDGAPDARIRRSLAQRAEPATEAGLSRATCRVEPAPRGARLTLRATLPAVGAAEHLVVDPPEGGMRVASTRSWREGNDLVADVALRLPHGAPLAFDRGALGFAVLTGERMFTARGCTGAP